MHKGMFSGVYFLVISILLTAAATAGILNASPDIFMILFTVSAWLIYASARSQGELRGFSLGHGTAKALNIVVWVGVGLLVVGGAMMIFFRGVFNRLFFSMNIMSFSIIKFPNMKDVLGPYSFIWFGLTLFVLAALLAVTNFILGRSLVVLTKSFDSCAKAGTGSPERVELAGRWLFVVGIIVSVGVLQIFPNPLGAFVCGCTGACMIVTSRWLMFEVLPFFSVEADIPRSEWYSPQD